MTGRPYPRWVLALITVAATLFVLFFLPLLILGVIRNELWPTIGIFGLVALVISLVRDEWRDWRP